MIESSGETSSLGPRMALPLLLQPGFLRDHVWPALDLTGRPAMEAGWETRVVQLTGTDRVTVEYRQGGVPRLYAKYFANNTEGLLAYGNLRALWESGFGAGSPYRVSEPVAYLPQEQVLLSRPASGECLLSLAGRGGETWREGLVAAARWLAALHNSDLRHGPPENLAQSMLLLTRRFTKVAARYPETEEFLLQLIQALLDRAAVLVGPRPQVQMHGRYHPGHVFVAPGVITVIDLDRSRPGDPALDVGEFIHRLRSQAVHGLLDPESVERSTAVFLEEYTSHSQVDLSGLTFYWSYSILGTLMRTLRKSKKKREEATLQQRLDYYAAEFYRHPLVGQR